MKKTLLILGFAIAIHGCKKSNDDNPAPVTSGTPSSQEIGAVPASATQKVLIEEFTGTWCGYCPDGALRLEAIITANPGKAIGAAVHDGDPMEVASLNNYLKSTYNVTGYPTGMVNRVPKPGATAAPMSRSDWASRANAMLAETAKCGLAVKSSIDANDSVSVEVHAGFFEPLTGNYNLVVYITEDKVHGTGGQWPQSNYNNTTTGHALFGLGNPITGTYYHNHVVRKVLTANAGDVITSSLLVAGGEFEKSFKFKLGTWDRNNMHIVAFVLKTGTSGTTYKVMNVQESKVGSVQNWD
jgi:thiol-disulfide isomerase/thioredoxin